MAVRVRHGVLWLLTCSLGLSPVSGQLLIAPAQTEQVQHPVYVEDSPAAQELGLEAKDLVELGRYADAAQKLQSMIEDHPHKLMPTTESTYIDALLWARGALRGDETLLEAYRRLYEPSAQRALSLAKATRGGPLDADGLRDVLTRFTQTRAGLEAGLILAAHHLERAEGGDASSVLDELADHPDLESEAGRYHLLRAVAAMLNADRDGYEQHAATLRDIGDGARLSELEALSNRVHPPLRLHAGHPAGEAGGFTLPKNLDEPLWDIDLLDELMQAMGGRPSLRGRPGDQVLLRVIPAGDAQKVYINRGERITAFDRASGWLAWEVLDSPGDPAGAQAYLPGRGLLTEPRGVYVTGGRSYGLIGWMNPNRNLQQATQETVSLVAIDAPSGEELWRVQPNELDATFELSAFDGTPTGDGGRLYVVVKRVRGSGLHDLYLTALRQTDGGLIWRRHLSSSSTQTHYNALPSARMCVHAGRVYVSDNRGTVYALDGRTGTVRWVTLLPDAGGAVPVSRRYAGALRDPAEPVVVGAGLLVPPVKVGGPYLLLDTGGGAVLRTLDGPDWSGVDACYMAGGDVLAMGSHVACFEGRTLTHRWRYRLEDVGDAQALGRPAIRSWGGDGDEKTQGVAVFSTARRLVALSLADGRELSSNAIESPGNVMLAPGQVFLASTSDLSAYTDWRDAHRQLLQRTEQAPTDPQPGMALARLAMRTGRDDAVLEGVDLSLAALKLADARSAPTSAMQGQVFAMLRALVDPANGADGALRGALLDRMAVSTADAQQEAAYQLTRGLYQQERGEPALAVEHFQAVLSDRAMASELYKVGRGSRRAGLEARRLLEALIEDFGREPYRPYDLLAEHELNELQAVAERDAERYAELAEKYPLASSANRARLTAADLFMQAGQNVRGLRQLQAVYLSSDEATGLAGVAGRVAQLHVDQQRPDLARRWLRRVAREHPGLTLMRDDQPVSAPAWLSELDYLLSATRRLPVLSPPLSEPEWIEGRPMPLAGEAREASAAHGQVLMTDGRDVWMLTVPKFETVWRRPLPAEDAQVLSQDERQVLWWSRQTGRLGAWDSRTGEPIWDDIDCRVVLDEAGDPQMRQDRRTDEQRQFIQLLGGGGGRPPGMAGEPSGQGVLTAVDPATVLIADDLGRAVCIDRATGTVRWRTLSASDSVTALTMGDGLVVLGGASWADTEAQHGVITLLDALTGEPLEVRIESEEVPLWLGYAENGRLVSLMQSGLACYDPTTGRTQWRCDLPRTPGGASVDLGSRLMLVSNQRRSVGAAQVGSVLVIDTDSGEVVNQLPYRTATGQPPMFEATEADGQWHTLTPMQAAALGVSGQTQWSDAVCAPVGHLVLQQVGREHVCLVSLSERSRGVVLPQGNFRGNAELEQVIRAQVAAGRIRISDGDYRLYLLDRMTGKIVSDTSLGELPAMISPESSVFLDQALLLGVGDRTLVVRGGGD